VFEADGATFVRDRSVPAIRDSNHVAHVTAATPEAIDRLLDRVEREFAGFPYRRFDLDFTTPPAFEARLALDGYTRGDALVMLLAGELRGAAPAHEVRPVKSDLDWDANAALHRLDWASYADRLGRPAEAEVGEAMFRAWRAKSPPVRTWMAYVDRVAAAYLSSWEGTDGVGQVEGLFTHPDHRHRGLATALLHRGVADCRAHGAGPVVIVCDPDDTPKQMYAALGFRPVAVKRSYWKTARQEGP
jgi:GNAT superfamily N-acetyltransferase